MEDARTLHYYGIEFSNGKPEGQEFYCILGRRQPTISEAREFTQGHFDTSGKPPVAVTEITEDEIPLFAQGYPALEEVFADDVFVPESSGNHDDIVIEKYELVAKTSKATTIQRRLAPGLHKKLTFTADAWGKEIFHTYVKAKAAVNSPEWKASHGLNPKAVLKIAQ